MGDTNQKLYLMLLTALETSVNLQFRLLKEEVGFIRLKAEDLGRIEAAYVAIKEDIHHIYETMKDSKANVNESIQRLHTRVDENQQFFLEKMGDINNSVSNATNRIESNLGSKVDVQGINLTALKSDYDQKISAIRAVWSVLGILFLLMQAIGAFVVKGYVSSWQERTATMEAAIVDNQKQMRKADDTIKELQNEILAKTK